MNITSKIHAAANELFEQHGKRPTIAQVRDYMGSGSFSTITKAMQDWQQPGAVVQATEPAAAVETAESKEVFDPNAVPEALQQSVMQAVKQVWITAKTEADQRISQIQAAAATQAEALQSALSKAEADADSAMKEAEAEHQAQIDELCSEVDRHEAGAAEKAQAITKMQTDIEGLGDRVSKKIDELEVATAQIKELDRQLKERDAAIAELKKTAEAANAKNEKLTTELATATANAASAEKAKDAAIKKADKLQDDNTKTVERAAKAEGRIAELEKQLKSIADTAKAEVSKSEKQK